MLDSHLHVVDARRTVADPTANPAGAWWERVDADAVSVVGRVRAAGVRGGVLVQAVGAHGLADNSVVLEAVAAHQGFTAVVTVDPSDTTALPQGAAGLRLFSIRDRWLDTPAAQELVDRCGQADITPSICCLSDELGPVDDLLAGTDVEIALDHAGFVEIGGDDGALADLARHDNLVVKLSTGVFDHAALDPAGTVDRLVDLVGADRLAWGSDHPQVNDRPYAELVTLAERATAHLAGSQRTAILEGTTARLWPDQRR